MHFKIYAKSILNSIIFRYAIGFLVIAWMWNAEALSFAPIRNLKLNSVFYCAIAGLSITVFSTMRIQILLTNQKIHLTFFECFVYSCVGLFYSLMLPGGISGDAVRAVLFSKRLPEKTMVSLGALIVDRVIGLVTLIMLGILSALFLLTIIENIEKYIFIFFSLMVFMTVSLLFVLRYEVNHGNNHKYGIFEKLVNMIKIFIDKLKVNEYKRSTIVASALLSVLMNVAIIFLIYMCAVENNSNMSFVEISAVSPIGLMTNAIPIAPGGLGIGEKSFDILFKVMGGINGAGAFLMARIFIYFPAVIGGIYSIYFLMNRDSKIS